jgi:hypothetical protein
MFPSQTKTEPTKQSKPSENCTCNLCSKVMTRRGLFNHMRLAHELSNADAKEATRRILQNTPYAYKGVKRLLTISIDENGVPKIKSGIKNEAELFSVLRSIENTLNVRMIFANEDISKKYRDGGNI